jgi:hypothetical protein
MPDTTSTGGTSNLAARLGTADIVLADAPLTTLRRQVRRTLGETTVHMAERAHHRAEGT